MLYKLTVSCSVVWRVFHGDVIEHRGGSDVRKSTIHRGTGTDLLRAAYTASDSQLSSDGGNASELQVHWSVGASSAACYH